MGESQSPREPVRKRWPPPTDTQIRLDVTTMLCQELGSPPDPVIEFYIREVSQMSNEHREKLRQKHLDMQ